MVGISFSLSISPHSHLLNTLPGVVHVAGTISSAKAVNEQAAVEIVAKSNKTTVLTGKKATLGYTSNMKTAYDKVTYEVVRGNARISGDGVYSESDYEIAIRVKIENEYGTFYSEEIVINEGMVKKKGCHSSLCMSGSILAGMVGMAMLVMKRSKKENE